MSSTQKVTVTILPEGSIVHRHTSALLDLKSRANVLRFMNIIVDETPIIPYEVRNDFLQVNIMFNLSSGQYPKGCFGVRIELA